MNFRKLGWIVSLVAFGAALGAEPQSLGEVAKREKARQAKARASATPAKVYTEEGSGDGSGSSDSTKGTFTVMDATPGSEPVATDRGDRPAATVTPSPRRTESARRAGQSGRVVNVTLYMTSWCPYCRRARALLGTLPNVQVTAHDIELNKAKHAEMLAKTQGRTGIPVIDIEGTVLEGYSPRAIETVIQEARAR